MRVSKTSSIPQNQIGIYVRPFGLLGAFVVCTSELGVSQQQRAHLGL